MKKALTIGLVILLALGAVYALYAADNVANTKHNLSSTGSGSYKTSSTTETCIFCHTPHGANQSIGPLWNRTAINTSGYTMYNSSTMDMTVDGTPGGVSAACLSCHDGVVAFDSLANYPGSGSTNPGWNWANGNKIANTSTAYMGKDLSNDHPISVTYSTSADSAFNAIANNKVGGLPLYSSKVECGSCHNPHDNTNGTFLRQTNAGSALCLKCHIK